MYTCSKYLLALFSSFCLSSCYTTLKFPLCEKLNRTTPSEVPGITKNLLAECKKRNIVPRVFNRNIAEFRGSRSNMKWLQKNYHLFLCDFDQNNTQLGAREYNTCLTEAENWIKRVQENPANLMDDGDDNLYCETCLPNSFCN